MKLFQIIVLIFIASFVSQSDPYGISELVQDRKKKKIKQTDTLLTNVNGLGNALRLEIIKGKEQNHPLFAVWIEDTLGNYIQTLYVAKSIANSIFNYGDISEGGWTTGVVRRPAALPYWSHKRGIVADDGLYMPSPETPVPDAYSGATPKNNSVLITRLDNPYQGKFNVLLEINQPWDWNEYWTNNKFPDDDEYKTSAQPALVYSTQVNVDESTMKFPMEVIGHSHYSGKDGSLTTDVSTLTTALEIADRITVYLTN